MDAIVVEELTKQYGSVCAVDRLSFTVPAGRITGFLGPNGAGKTTTLRALVGLIRPTSGTATFAGVSFADLHHPARQVGAVLEVATSFHPGRRAVDHLRILATAGQIPATRVDEVLGIVGLGDVAGRRVGGFSLGMRQRLGLAAALLGDPGVLILDEPANGLDPEGVRWLRDLLKELSRQGRTVLISSHLLAEVAETVDDVVVVAAGRLVTHRSLAELRQLAGDAGPAVRIKTPQTEDLYRALAAGGMAVSEEADGSLTVTGATAAQIGRAVADAGLVVYEMRPVEHRLEDVFLELTNGRPN